MNTVKNFTAIHLHLSQIDVLQIVTLNDLQIDRCVGSCNTLNDSSSKVCIPNKTGDLNLSVFNMITGIIESKALTKHISSAYKCKLDGTKCNSNKWWNNKDRCECKDIIYMKKIIFGILLHVIVRMEYIQQVLWMVQ